MAGALRELIAFFGVQVDDKPLDAAGKKMEGLAKNAERAAGLIGIAFSLKEIGEFITGQIEMAAELAHTSVMLGLSVGDLQAFQYAASTAGLSVEESTNAVRFLNKNIGEAATKGGEGATAFQKLGVHLKDAGGNIRPTNDILAEAADGFTKLKSPAEKTAMAMTIFGRAGARMIPLLNKGSAGIGELSAEFEKLGGGIDEEFIEQAEQGEHALAKLSLVGRGLKSTIASALLPGFMALVDKAVAAGAAFRAFAEHSYIVQDALVTLGGVALTLAGVWAVMNWEVLAVAVAVAILVLAVDDVYTAFRGGKSVIGEFIDDIFGIGATKVVFQNLHAWINRSMAVVRMLGDGFRNVGLSIKEAVTGIAVGTGAMSFADYKKAQDDIAKSRAGIIADEWKQEHAWDDAKPDDMAKSIGQNEDEYAKYVASGDIGPKESKSDWYRHSGRSASGVSDEIETVEAPYIRRPMTATAYAPPGAGGGGDSHSETHQEVNVTVTGGDNPRDTGKKVGQAAAKALKDTHEDDYDGSPSGGGH